MQAHYQFIGLELGRIFIQIHEFEWRAEGSEVPSNGMAVVFARKTRA